VSNPVIRFGGRISVATILVVEDDIALGDTLAYNLRQEEYVPVIASDAPDAIRAAREERPDLILLDLMLPGGSGFDVLKAVREFSTAPVIILTARDDDIDRVLGLELGADDYMTKPFSLRVLLARIKANLRRVDLDRAGQGADTLQHGSITVDVRNRQVWVGSQSVTFQPKEFDLLVYLLRNPATVLTRDRLLHAVWGHEFVGERTVDVHVRRVRAKLESAGAANPVRTVHGVGYALACETDVAEIPAQSGT
jgi:DNA-binding response OmpR family regulator